MKTKFIGTLISILLLICSIKAQAIDFFDGGIEYWPTEKKIKQQLQKRKLHLKKQKNPSTGQSI